MLEAQHTTAPVAWSASVAHPRAAQFSRKTSLSENKSANLQITVYFTIMQARLLTLAGSSINFG